MPSPCLVRDNDGAPEPAYILDERDNGLSEILRDDGSALCTSKNLLRSASVGGDRLPSESIMVDITWVLAGFERPSFVLLFFF